MHLEGEEGVEDGDDDDDLEEEEGILKLHQSASLAQGWGHLVQKDIVMLRDQKSSGFVTFEK